ncbi:hypothetical protein FQZ97_1220740 [compost metagenome]
MVEPSEGDTAVRVEVVGQAPTQEAVDHGADIDSCSRGERGAIERRSLVAAWRGDHADRFGAHAAVLHAIQGMAADVADRLLLIPAHLAGRLGATERTA